MINKAFFGSRIAENRRRLGLTQTELSEQMRVTPQSVSKWENGISLPDLETLLELSHFFDISINELLEGHDLLSKIASRPYIMDEIALFLPEGELEYNREWAIKIEDEHWVQRNWNYVNEHMDDRPVSKSVSEKIIQRGGITLITGIGPGGSNLPFLLKLKPDIKAILNDLSPTVIREWKRLLSPMTQYTGLTYAVFDFCEIPLAEGSIDTISDFGGLFNCEGDFTKAIPEFYRILTPGGLLISTGSYFPPEVFQTFPDNVKEDLFQDFSIITTNMYDNLVGAGFIRIDTEITGKYYPSPGDSRLGDYMEKVHIHEPLCSFIRYCYK